METVEQARTIHQLFEAQATATPDAVAVVCAGQRLSYQQLNQQADKIAQTLIQSGVHPGDIVALVFPRSIHLMAAILGVLKAGGAYLAIDANYPLERIQWMLEKSGSGMILCTPGLLHELSVPVLMGIEQQRLKVKRTKAREPLHFDSLPIPNRGLISFSKYAQYCKMSLARKVVTIQGTRGCPYRCAYCHRIWPKSHSRRSSENIFNEIKLNYDAGIRKFSFLDDIFNLDYDESSRLFQKIIDEKLELQLFFPNGMRGDLLDKKYIDLMVKAGLVHIALSLETASPRLQKLLNKNLNIEVFREQLTYLVETYPDVMVDLFTMHGLPTETEEEARQTMEFIQSIKWLHFPYIFILRIFPNTEMYELALNSGISEEAILRSVKFAYHELTETLVFPKEFTITYQSQLFKEYILNKERLRNVIPAQMKWLTEDEFVQQYNIYFPQGVTDVDSLFKLFDLDRSEFEGHAFQPDDQPVAEAYDKNIHAVFPVAEVKGTALKVLFIDCSQIFSADVKHHDHLNETPLGLMYLATYLRQNLGDQFDGKIIKPMIDFDNYHDLKRLIEDFQPDIIGLRALSYYQEFFHETAMMIRHWGFSGPLIAGGPYATSHFETLLQDVNIDLAVIGEGEATFLELLKFYLTPQQGKASIHSFESIEGIAYVDFQAAQSGVRNRSVILFDESQSMEELGFAPPVVASGELAYVIFTSGSTGKPKGNYINHQDLIQVFQSWDKVYELGKSAQSVLQVSSFSFDVSVGDWTKALLSGGKLVIADEEERMDAQKLCQLVAAESVSSMESTAGFIQFLLQVMNDTGIDLSPLQLVIVGGEPVSLDQYCSLVNLVPADTRVINGYGLTEAVIESFYYESRHLDFFSQGVCPIGKPFPHVKWALLDRQSGKITKHRGELLIGGPLARKEAPDGSAVLNIFESESNGEVFLKTGDEAEVQADGNLLILGRYDQQLQVRGHRVEPSEIEAVLSGYPGVQVAVVVGQKDHFEQVKLHAFYEADHEIGVETLRRYLRRTLPDYLIPHQFNRLSHIPRLPNGKVARGEVLDQLGQSQSSQDDMAGNPELEAELKGVWRQVLGLESFSIYDSFFDLGGDSLDVIRCLAFFEQKGFSCSLTEFYQMRTISELATFMSRQIRGKSSEKLSDPEEIAAAIKQELSLDIAFEIEKFEDFQQTFQILHIQQMPAVELKKKVMAWMEQHVEFEARPHYLLFGQQSLWEEIPPARESEMIADLLKSFRKQELQYFNSLLSGGVNYDQKEELFGPYFRQLNRSAYTSERIVIDATIPRHRIEIAVSRVVAVHEMCRAALMKNWKGYKWNIYRQTTSLKLPYLDLSDILPDFSYSFSFEVLSQYFNKDDKLKAFPFRIFLVKMDQKRFNLCFLMDESIHDKRGADIFRQHFWAAFNQQKIFPAANYSIYLRMLNRGPQNLPPARIMEHYELADYRRITKTFMGFQQTDLANFSWSKVLDNQHPLQDNWVVGIAFLYAFYHAFFQDYDIPILTVHDCRGFGQHQFRSTIGEFTDFVPVIIRQGETHESLVEKMTQKLRLSTSHAVHFESLRWNKHLPVRYGALQKLAREAIGMKIGEIQPVLLFHFRVNVDEGLELPDYEDSGPGIKFTPWIMGAYFRITFSRDRVFIEARLPEWIQGNELNSVFERTISSMLPDPIQPAKLKKKQRKTKERS